MLTFAVNDMTCGHCASTITKALQALDKGARVQVDLNAHRVQVESSANAADLAAAIKAAGYTPVAVSLADAAKPAQAGGCCGCCR
jgi:copper chaperone